MNQIDASDHYEVANTGETASLSTVILDVNPRAWSALSDVLPISKALSNVLIYLNANLAFSNTNQVAVIASHTNRAVWLYPTKPEPSNVPLTDGDVAMSDAPPKKSKVPSANKFTQFAQVEDAVLRSLKKLLDETTEADLDCTTTQLSGALTLALAHINKVNLSYTASLSSDTAKPMTTAAPGLSSHILVVSVSDSDPSQYISTMNAVFAAAHASIPIDVLSLSPATAKQTTATQSTDPNDPHKPASSSSFLQQASHITNGTFLEPPSPLGLLAYLTFGLAVADTRARAALVPPTHHTVDFRAACFCHGRVIDTGFVCSVCLSIFCSVPEGADCLTCGTHLALGHYGAKPAVVPRKKKKRKKQLLPNGSIREVSGTPVAGGTPMR
ncbi:General transcription and DNA repair factor IIH subunit tfb4 like protein [Verticillium longisporum]|nr:General transcription and DNA repair factor IIH subunit tfb4 like protein [Verticillium longisporum]